MPCSQSMSARIARMDPKKANSNALLPAPLPRHVKHPLQSIKRAVAARKAGKPGPPIYLQNSITGDPHWTIFGGLPITADGLRMWFFTPPWRAFRQWLARYSNLKIVLIREAP